MRLPIWDACNSNRFFPLGCEKVGSCFVKTQCKGCSLKLLAVCSHIQVWHNEWLWLDLMMYHTSIVFNWTLAIASDQSGTQWRISNICSTWYKNNLKHHELFFYIKFNSVSLIDRFPSTCASTICASTICEIKNCLHVISSQVSTDRYF